MRKALFVGIFFALTTICAAQKIEFRDGGAIATLSAKPEKVMAKSRDNQTYYLIRFDNIIFLTSKEQFSEISEKLDGGEKVRVDSWFVNNMLLFNFKQLKKASLRLGVSVEKMKMYKVQKFASVGKQSDAWGQ